ncbi:hypothetical protein C4D60_Mb04t26310 [Musa balbisiana]|uniref:Fungal lipase-type domain-containing protein n=1 Tax=Musa balbisiana TaxID=52838 RepID=A0A4V4HA17_MUSBA|nr:hypothetical protein C4D60_Mb04t26310 [Musa balbisiana]
MSFYMRQTKNRTDAHSVFFSPPSLLSRIVASLPRPMSLGSAPAAPPRHVSPVRNAFHRRRTCSPLAPLVTRPRAATPFNKAVAAAGVHVDGSAAASSSPPAAVISTRNHLSNLERLLQKKQAPPPPHLVEEEPEPRRHSPSSSIYQTRGRLLNALNLSSAAFLNSSDKKTEEMSPRSLTRLHRLLSDSTRPSPRGTIGPRWRQYHGAANWDGLLEPLDVHLRRELVRYGELVQATYHAFHSNLIAAPPDRPRPVVLPDWSYRVTRNLFATASVELPSWVQTVAPWMMAAQRTSWIGYVAVCDNEREIQRMGRRDIVIALRGTSTCLEWAENLRTGLVPVDDYGEDVTDPHGDVPKVECGFRSLYKTAGPDMPSLSSSVVAEVRKLTEKYAGEEISITVVGHSLGAALAVLIADELAARAPPHVPTTVFSFGSPRVGNQAFAARVERRGVKVLRVVNARDLVTRVPMVLPSRTGGYAHVGRELLVDCRMSPYLRPDADPACCHDLEAYLHLVDGFMATNSPFRSDAKRSLARLLTQQSSNVKKLYVSKARDIQVQSTPGFPRRHCGHTLPSTLSIENLEVR